jgi:morphogenetic protein associated with SpoVID
MVKSGDTMYNIAQKHGVQLEQLIAFNPQISNPDQIDVGMKVKIPSAVGHEGNPHVEYAQKHVVKQGDSLWKISKAWGLPLKALVDANPQLKNPSVLLTGEIVNIPQQASTTGSLNMAKANNAINPAAISPNMSYVSNIQNMISPGNAPQAMPLPTPVEAKTKPVEAITKPVESITKPFPVSQQEVQQLPQYISQPAAPTYYGNEPNKNMMEPYPSPYSSESPFAQFDVPAVEAQGKPDQFPTYQMPAYSAEQPMMNSPYMASKSDQFPTYQMPDYPAEQPMMTSPYMASKPDQMPSYQMPDYPAEQPMICR